MRELLRKLKIDYLLVNSTNEYLVEYSSLSENARYTLTGFSGSTGDALITMDKIYLFVDGRYHVQAEQEIKNGIELVKLQLGQKQDDEIRKLLNPKKTLGIFFGAWYLALGFLVVFTDQYKGDSFPFDIVLTHLACIFALSKIFRTPFAWKKYLLFMIK